MTALATLAYFKRTPSRQVFGFSGSTWIYGLRTVVAVCTALFAAYYLQLTDPASAATTVLIVANPAHGMVLSKSVWRFAGTIVGGLGSILLIGAFAQTPELFILGLALWAAVFSAIGSLMRHFRAYAAVLAGYTVALVALQVVSDPLQVFDAVVSRVEVVTVGVICSAVLSGIFPSAAISNQLPGAMRAAIYACLRPLSAAIAIAERHTPIDYSELLSRIHALDAIIEGASSESASLSVVAPAYRYAASRLIGVVALSKALEETRVTLAGTAWESDLCGLRKGLNDFLAGFEPNATSLHSLREITEQLADAALIRSNLSSGHGGTALRAAAAKLSGVSELLADLTGDMKRIEGGRSSRRLDRVAFPKDIKFALLNAARTLTATILIGGIWIVDAVPDGAPLLAGVVITCCLLATSETPTASALQYAKGVAVAAVVAPIFTFWVLPSLTEFLPLSITLGVFILPGVLASTRSGRAMMAAGYLIFFTVFSGPDNPPAFNPIGMLNSELAWTLGALLGALAFRIILPVDSGRMLLSTSKGLRDDLCTIILGKAKGCLNYNETRLTFRALGLALHPEAFSMAARCSPLVVVQLGLQIIHTQHLVSNLRLDHPALLREADRVSIAMMGLQRNPERAVSSLDRVAEILSGVGGGHAEIDSDLIKVAAAVKEVSDLARRNMRFLQQR